MSSIWNVWFHSFSLSLWTINFLSFYPKNKKYRDCLKCYITDPLVAVRYCQYIEDTPIMYKVIKTDKMACHIYFRRVREDIEEINNKIRN